MRIFKFICVAICLSTTACGTASEVRDISANTTSALSELNKELGKAQRNAQAANKQAAAEIAEMKLVALNLKVFTGQQVQLDGLLNIGKGDAVSDNKKLYDALVGFTALRQQELQATVEGSGMLTKQALAGLQDLKIPSSELKQIAAKLAELRKNDGAFENLKSMFDYMLALSKEIKALQKAAAAN